METKYQNIMKEQIVILFLKNYRIVVSDPKNLESYKKYIKAIRELRSSLIKDLRIDGAPSSVRVEINNVLEKISHPNHRQYLFHKDPVCKICYKLIKSIREANIDHIIPISKGGLNVLSNKQIAHVACNIKKGNRIM